MSVTSTRQVETRTVYYYNAVLDAITEVVAAGDSLAIPGFGTFGTVKRPERTVRNPQNGEPVTVPEHIAPVFKAGKRFRDAVKG